MADLRRKLFLAQRTIGDVKAVTRGRIWQRIWNRWIGRKSNRLMRKVWK